RITRHGCSVALGRGRLARLSRRVARHRRDEGETPSRKRLHESRVLRRIAKGSAQLADAVCEAAIEVDVGGGIPEVRAQFAAGDQLAGAGNQQAEGASRLRLERHRPIRSGQRERPIVEREDAEAVFHLSTPWRVGPIGPWAWSGGTDRSFPPTLWAHQSYTL